MPGPRVDNEDVFSRPLRVDAIPAAGVEQRIEAGAEERAALAKFIGLPAIARLEARFGLRPLGRGVIRVQGEVHAEVTQTCVVTLEPFDATLDEPVDVRFAASPRELHERRAAGGESAAEEESPDPIIDGKIDLGALAAEFLVLGLDPWPRKPGAEFAKPQDASPQDASPQDAAPQDGPAQKSDGGTAKTDDRS